MLIKRYEMSEPPPGPCPRIRSLRFHVGDAWIQSDIQAGVVKRQCAGLPACREMPLFAVTSRWTYNRATYLATGADHSGERNGRTVPRHAAFREPVGRPARLVEGDRGIPQPGCDNGPALGETGGDAGPPTPARQDRLGVRV